MFIMDITKLWPLINSSDELVEKVVQAVLHSYLVSGTTAQGSDQLKILQPGNISGSSLVKYDSSD